MGVGLQGHPGVPVHVQVRPTEIGGGWVFGVGNRISVGEETCPGWKSQTDVGRKVSAGIEKW